MSIQKKLLRLYGLFLQAQEGSNWEIIPTISLALTGFICLVPCWVDGITFFGWPVWLQNTVGSLLIILGSLLDPSSLPWQNWVEAKNGKRKD
jgi:hypothetical protein